MTEVEFKVGQEVVVRRNLGVNSGQGGGRYYYGGDLKEVPLGTKAIIDMVKKDNIHLRFENTKYGSNGWWYAHPQELYSTEDQTRDEREQQAKVDSLLESVVLDETSTDEILLAETQTRNARKVSFVGGLVNRIKDLFGYYPSQLQKLDTLLDKTLAAETGIPRRSKFDPKFNVREEFAVWVREQFPDLSNYAQKGRVYQDLEDRRQEVYDAAKLACDHGLETTEACVKSEFAYLRATLKDTRHHDISYPIYQLVKFIEHVSANLRDKGTRHYGTHLARSDE